MIAWFTRNHVAANLLMIFILFMGFMSLKTRIPLEVFPSFEAEVINVSMSLRGSTPEEVEEAIAVRIEEAVQDLEGIKKISSRSSEGSASVSIEIESGYDERDMLNDIKSRIDAINTFPNDADKPVISLAIRKREVISVAVAGDFSESEIRQHAEIVRDDLSRLPSVTQIELSEVRNYEIAVEVSEDTLREYGMRLSDVASAISNSSLDLSAGNVKTTGGEVLIRLKGQAYRRADFDNIVVLTRPDGSIIRVGDLAKVNDGFEEEPLSARFNGKRAAMIEVYRVGDQSAIEVADAVKEYVESRQHNLPSGLEMRTWRDSSETLKARLQTLSTSALQGGILVLLLLTLFLRPSVAFWVFLGIPVCFMGAFIFMPFFGVTLNIFSLFAFILVLGIVVDDAIVTGENVYRHMGMSNNSEEAAIRGTQEVSVPVTFGVLTTVAAFLPLAFIEGTRGQLFAQIPVVIVPVLLFSLIESKFVLPAHLKHIKLRQEKENENAFTRFQKRFADGFEQGIIKFYQPLLDLTLRNRYTALAIFFGVLLTILTSLSSGWTKFVFFPRIQSETATATLNMPAGTPFEVTDRHVQRMIEAAAQLKERYRDEETGESVILDILGTSGSGGGRGSASNKGRVRFEIIPPESRTLDVTSPQLVNEWRQIIGPIPGAETLNYRAEFGRAGDPIDIQFSGGDFVQLREVADLARERLGTYPTVFDIADSLSDGKEEVRLELKPSAYALGINQSDAIRQVREAFYGYEVQRIQRGRDDVRVMVRYPKSERVSINNLENVNIRTAEGKSIPLAQVIRFVPGKSATTINRIDRFRTVNVTADIDKNNTNMTVLSADLRTYLDDMLARYPGISYTLEGESREQADSFGSLGYGVAFALFLIYALLAIPFKSYAQPAIVMSVIPFGLIGAVIGHWIMGMDLTLISILGMLALVGVVVNDSLVLVDFVNKRRLEGMVLIDAVKKAGVYRFRPVLLTSMTTFIGLMPLLFEKSTQAQFLIPMAVSLGFGIVFATLITLLLVPVNYLVIEDIRRVISGKAEKRALPPLA